MADTAIHKIMLGQRQSLSLTQLHEHLNSHGVDIAYSSLSQFINNGDIADQLGAGGKRNRRTFPLWAAEFLVGFLPHFTATKMQNSMAPDAMRHALASRNGSGPKQLLHDAYEVSETSLLPMQSQREPLLPAASSLVLERLAEVLEKLSIPPEDCLLASVQAAEILACRPRSVSRYVKAVRPGIFRKSDCLTYIQNLGRSETGTYK